MKHCTDSEVLTIKRNGLPNFYMDIVRRHFLNGNDEIKLEALESAISKMIMIAQLLNCSGMVDIKKFKLESKHVPMHDSQTGKDIDKFKIMSNMKITLVITEYYRDEMNRAKGNQQRSDELQNDCIESRPYFNETRPRDFYGRNKVNVNQAKI